MSSKVLQIAFVVEGTTDYIMLQAVVKKILNGRDFVSHSLQPEFSEAFTPVPTETGFGWGGVCRWCRQNAGKAAGAFANNSLFDNYELLIVQVDADVAASKYADAGVKDPFPDATLPFEEPCPPPSATTDRLRAVILRWLGEGSTPPKTVLCMPSKELETWLLVGLFPENKVVKQKNDIECRADPKATLQGEPKKRRLVSGGKPIRKKYEEYAPVFASQWGVVVERCTEAARFESDLKSAIPDETG
jgi:hypothetical protein